MVKLKITKLIILHPNFFQKNVFKEVRGVSSTKIHSLRHFQIIQAVLEKNYLTHQIGKYLYKEVLLN
jgi:hypothetical protein